ncbi:MAG: hypothetical protein COT91_04325 [Candidatus Doudnabacteria bacterium CG10_big_fil_rev_8_21_14_0_10_41_10]|uniref:Uncharacterized protein n=1 Tax=Candidatus Doudnabacteria bacterium CG10_big_fil_rev_8_21_14_0_10_41_10 TaxID=1974551 RepID=A0A2H0VF00_9BACT|nr:MAG: hypothetical protein COT91_04325 [Candidatus Doudnabacteria bacterium CG10_big_fil_rev_8_21_14_0_10_41_10]
MAEEEQKKSKDYVKSGAGHAASAAFLKVRKPFAKYIAKNLPNPMRNWATTWSAGLPFLSTFIATVTPDTGLWKQIDDFQQDLCDAVQEELNSPSSDKTPATDEERRAAEATRAVTPDARETYFQVCVAAGKLPEEKRNRFFDWYLGGSEERRTAFNILIRTAKKGDLDNLLKASIPEIEKMLYGLPAKQSMSASLRLIDLTKELGADAELKTATTSCIVALGLEENPDKFWSAVESQLGTRIQTLEDFRALVSGDTSVARTILNLKTKPGQGVAERLNPLWEKTKKSASATGEKIGDDVTKTGVVTWLQQVALRTQKWADKPLVKQGDKS